MAEAFEIRTAGPGDAATIARQRAAMFGDLGDLTDAQAAELVVLSMPAIEDGLRAGTYRGWLAVAGDRAVIAGAGVLLRPLLPRPDALQGPEAYILNVYVEPSHRRAGVARALMATVLESCRREGLARVVLHPSAAGRRLYESVGFEPTDEMVYRGG